MVTPIGFRYINLNFEIRVLDQLNKTNLKVTDEEMGITTSLGG